MTAIRGRWLWVLIALPPTVGGIVYLRAWWAHRGVTAATPARVSSSTTDLNPQRVGLTGEGAARAPRMSPTPADSFIKEPSGRPTGDLPPSLTERERHLQRLQKERDTAYRDRESGQVDE